MPDLIGTTDYPFEIRTEGNNQALQAPVVVYEQ